MKLTTITKFVIFAAIAALNIVSAFGQELRLAVFRGNECYEVVQGSNTGGRFVRQSRKVGVLTLNGYTDRVAKGERVSAIVLGTGRIPSGAWLQGGMWFEPKYNLPLSNYGVLNATALYNDMKLYVQKANGAWLQKSVPIGTRP